MLGALAIDVRAGQTDISQHAVVESQEQVPAARPFPPTPKPAREVREQPMQSSGSEDDGQPIRRQTPACIDTISTVHLIIIHLGRDRNQIDSE
jgi:hypothetical protein